MVLNYVLKYPMRLQVHELIDRDKLIYHWIYRYKLYIIKLSIIGQVYVQKLVIALAIRIGP